MDAKTKIELLSSVIFASILVIGVGVYLYFGGVFDDKECPQERPQVKVSMEEDLFTNQTKIKAYVTNYTAIETCPSKTCINASGTNPRVNHSVACPRIYELQKTRVLIQGKEYTCDDRQALWIEEKYQNSFDIFVGYTEEDYKKALEFGRQEIEVIIIK